eukprot:CAMPEP_0182428448 /NCGR_PEP_ID=MMETSP1167-20130531/23037_1 /TAXON_ID=2988 /ORGANISM="Mallomonas Sp, Strain CCMP3275" /LENGTH=191 /DNA_ID=CAMNT_0024611379 /DNA_START=221 /DNA_END=796 /DNA_ORIENTATION=+
MAYAAIAGSGVLAAIYIKGRLFNRFDTAADIPGNFFKSRKTLVGKVIKVSDGDTFRMRHLPSIFSSASFKGKLSDHTIAVRIAAVNTPETAKFGNKSEVLGDYSSEFTKGEIMDKKVKVRLLSKDQYGRVVGQVYYRNWFSSKDLSEVLLKKGLAKVYRQTGAVYGDEGLEKWDKIEAKAKEQGLGIWGKS